MVQRLYGDSLASEQWKKEKKDGRSEQQEGREDLHLRPHQEWRLPLQSLHVQELQLLSDQVTGTLGMTGVPSYSEFA